MKTLPSIALLVVSAPLCLPALATTCESLQNESLAQASITSARTVPMGTFVPEHDSRPIHDVPAFCRVEAVLTPSPDSRIRIEVWMPAQGWNGKYEGTGNGGFAGVIAYGALADGLRRGYAVANTDMGTARPMMDNADALIGHPEKWADWGWRATHEMTVAAKKIIRAYYGRDPQLSYFTGCSTGGEQALMEAQRFPDDYDGIIAGAPANNRTRLHMDILWNFAAAEKDPADYIPPAKLQIITEAMLKACGKAKGVNSDAFLSFPEQCQWDPAALQCTSGEAANCLTANQVATARKLYDGPRNPATHQSTYPGLPRGSEFGWAGAMPQTGRPPYDSIFKWVFGPTWNWKTFDFNRNVAAVDARLGPMVNATSPDLSAFKARGHKLIAFHGWGDWLVPPQESLNYYGSVAKAQAAAARGHERSTEQETQSFYRLFMVPGMSHCSGGPGLNTVDLLPSLELWVEQKIAPESVIAKRVDEGKTVLTRPLCPYPKTARYNGTGDAANFFCANPSQK
jgi:feruloyl esterase